MTVRSSYRSLCDVNPLLRRAGKLIGATSTGFSYDRKTLGCLLIYLRYNPSCSIPGDQFDNIITISKTVIIQYLAYVVFDGLRERA